MNINPILLEIFKNRFAAIAEEMGVTLNRTAFSSNIKERRDFSCAVFDKSGNIVAQAAHIPVHLGSMPLSVKAALKNHTLLEGDMVMLNDPFMGGTHLPDMTVVAPVYINNKGPVFYVANRAHHSDVGGKTPGSMPISSSIFQEGIIIPPLKILEKGEINTSLLTLILKNVRTPVEREGDFSSQIMANLTGIKRLQELTAKYHKDTVAGYAKEIINYSEKITRQTIKKIPDGTYSFEDFMDDDGYGKENIHIPVIIQVKNDTMQVDFSESDIQATGCINAIYAVTLSAVLYVLRSLIKEDIPANAGCMKPVTVKTRKGTVVDAEFPAAVAGGNVETAQRIVDVILGALAKAIPDLIPAASQGTMNNITLGGTDHRNGSPFVYYETIGGGMGASAFSNGESAVQSHMTNTLNTPVEALEYSYPFMVTEYAIRRDSGGRGKFTGGNGIIREIKLNADAEVTVLSERRTHPPYGLSGGKPGKPGVNMVIKNGRKKINPGKFSEVLHKGDIIRIETPGGGGHGTPQEPSGDA